MRLEAYRPLGFSIGANIVVRLQLRRPPPSASITDILRTTGAELAVHGAPGAGHNLTRTDVAHRSLMADLSGLGLRWTPPSRQPAAEPVRD